MTQDNSPIRSTGLNWPLAALREKHKFLRKLKEPVRFSLLLYPYWLVAALGRARGRWLPGRQLECLGVLDGLGLKPYLVHNMPEILEERWQTDENGLTYVPAAGEPLPLEAVHMAQGLCPREEAQTAAHAWVMGCWQRKFKKVWRPSVDIALESLQLDMAWKPYWLMTPEIPCEQDAAKKFFLFDATTGMGGVYEFRPVVEYVWHNILTH